MPLCCCPSIHSFNRWCAPGETWCLLSFYLIDNTRETQFGTVSGRCFFSFIFYFMESNCWNCFLLRKSCLSSNTLRGRHLKCTNIIINLILSPTCSRPLFYYFFFLLSNVDTLQTLKNQFKYLNFVYYFGFSTFFGYWRLNFHSKCQ